MGGRLGIALFCGLAVAPHPARADVVTEWSARAQDIAVASKVPPVPATRLLAIVQSAVYEAVNAVTRRYPPARVAIDPDPDASVAAANRAALARLVPTQKA